MNEAATLTSIRERDLGQPPGAPKKSRKKTERRRLLGPTAIKKRMVCIGGSG